MKEKDATERNSIESNVWFDGHQLRNSPVRLSFRGTKIERIEELSRERFNTFTHERPRNTLLMPGFIDGHCHFMHEGLSALHANLSDCSSRFDVIDVLKKRFNSTPPNDTIIGVAWDESSWSDKKFPSRQDLDSISSTKPIIAWRVCTHLAVINSAARELIPRYLFQGDYDQGHIVEDAAWLLEKKTEYTEKQRINAINVAQNIAFSKGVTGVNDITSVDHFKLYQNLDRQGKLKIRISAYLPRAVYKSIIKMGLMSGYGSDHLRFGGIKIFADGSLGARTAALSKGYADAPGKRGVFLVSKRELTRIIADIEETSISLMIHAIGDRAIKHVIDAFYRNSAKDYSAFRHRLEHIEVMTPENAKRFAELGLLASVQPNFARRWSVKPGGMNWERLGAERMQWCNPYARLLEENIPLAFGSDCMPFSPLYGLGGAVNHPQKDLAIPLEDALKAYTSGSATASWMDSMTGTLEVGKKADFVLIKCNADGIPDFNDSAVLATYCDGQCVYEK